LGIVVYNPLSLNLYTYTENNPLIKSDPSGHSSVESWGKVISRFKKQAEDAVELWGNILITHLPVVLHRIYMSLRLV
jgi:hypothetical protein